MTWHSTSEAALYSPYASLIFREEVGQFACLPLKSGYDPSLPFSASVSWGANGIVSAMHSWEIELQQGHIVWLSSAGEG